ncbi:MAG: dipeptidase [Acidobacteria bacterium]|nr:dipeptidase [Acidobacteriota bacterium]
MGLAAISRDATQGDEALLARARSLMTQVPLIDGHNDLPWAMRNAARYDFGRIDIRQPQPTLHTDIPRLREGHVGAQFWSVYVPASLQGEEAVVATLEQVDAVYEMVRRYPDAFELVRTADEVERVFKAGRIASMMGIEGGHSIGASLGALRMFKRLGVGYMTLTHSANVPWADASTDAERLGGLSRFGEEVVREMNRLGMLVDLSHVSPGTMAHALRVTASPVIFSHSSARALCDVPRNVPDDVLRRMPDNGGVVMVTFVPGFISQEVADYGARLRREMERVRAAMPDDPTGVARAMEQWRASHAEPRATLAQVADHIDHIRRVAGIDHVGIGGDFDGISTVPVGLEDVSTYPALIAELLRRGYTDEDVKKLLGLNLLRVMRKNEEVAARLGAERGPSLATFDELDGTRD